jgi:hypothetical protein
MNNNKSNSYDYINNNINFSVTITASCGENDDEEKDVISFDINDFINKFAVTLLSDNNPKRYLCALLYSVNYDVGILIGCNNSITSIASNLGISKQDFSGLVKKIQSDYNLKTNTGMLSESKNGYKSTNYRKFSNK